MNRPEKVREETRIFFQEIYSRCKDKIQEIGKWETKENLIMAPITFDEIKDTICRAPNGKAKDGDGIVNEFPKYSNDEIIIKLTKYLNDILQNGKIPDEWRKSTIFLLVKNLKADPAELENRSPISITNYYQKILNTILAKRLQVYLQEINYFGKEQAAFLKKLGTDHQVRKFTRIIHK